MKEAEKQEKTDEKKHKKWIWIVLLVMVLLLAMLGAGFYYLYTEGKAQIAEIEMNQKEAFLEFAEEVGYQTELDYEELMDKLVDKSKLPEGTKQTMKINENTIAEGEKIAFYELGTYSIKITLDYEYTNSLLSFLSKMIESEKITEIAIKDTEKPTITGVANKEITVGDSIDLKAGITANDNVDGELEIAIEGEADTAKAGNYEIKVKATDKSGNVQEATFTVTVKEKPKTPVQTSTSKSTANQSTNNKTVTSQSNTSTTPVKKEFTKEELLAAANSAKSTYRSQINTIFNRTNGYRKEKEIENLVLDEQLTTAACARAIEMAHSGVVAHTRPDGRSCFSIFEDMSIFEMACGENIAYKQPNAEGAVSWWRNSPGHYANMTKTYFKKIGIGAYKLNGTYYWVQLFTD